MHKPIQLKSISFFLPNKTCFSDFSAQINYGDKIAIIGRNGSGKSTLLKMLLGELKCSNGTLIVPIEATLGYVPQVINNFECLSGAQRFNKALSESLAKSPDVLLLDEPTNHLDYHNRKSLLRMLRSYSGTLIVATHDTELLRSCIDTLWHIDDGKIHIFSGNYDDYMRESHTKRSAIEKELSHLSQQKKAMHECLMQEQLRAVKSKAKGKKSIEQRKWPTIVSVIKATRGEETSGRNKAAINHKKQKLSEELSNLRLPEIINPKFSLPSTALGEHTLVAISNGTISYPGNQQLLTNINLSLGSHSRIAIKGNNGSGKSTLVKAIMGGCNILKTGIWHTPKTQDIGYIDQHYNTLDPNFSVLHAIGQLMSNCSHAEVRCHLNNFLFRKNEEVNAIVNTLSGG